MATKRVLKKGIREIFILVILVIIAIFVGIRVIKTYSGDKYKLGKIGYTNEEISKIIELNKVDFFLNHTYHSKIIDMMRAKYYIESKLDDYLSYYDNHTEVSIDDIVAIINVGADKEFYTNVKETDLSKGNAILVNKYYKLPDDYEPDNLVNISNWYSYGSPKTSSDVYDAFLKMYKQAKKEDLTIIINDGYRSFESQKESWKKYGDDTAARVGHSEHNTGLALDIISLSTNSSNFDQSDEFKWLMKHAHEYGFILRYPKGKEYITGYDYESWHFRYLGVDLATKVYNSGLTYDEYYAYYIDNQ